MRQPPGTIRAFVALDLPTEARHTLATTIRRLREAVPRGVRWVDPEGIHLTLKFMASLEARQTAEVLAAVDRAARGFRPFRLRLAGLGMFPNPRQPRVLWAGVEGDLEPLRVLQERVEREVSALGLPQERHAFNPHLTLGRVREDATQAVRQQIALALEAAALDPSDPWTVSEVHLVRSTLTPHGPEYTLLGSVGLTRNEGAPPS